MNDLVFLKYIANMGGFSSNEMELVNFGAKIARILKLHSRVNIREANPGN